MTEEDIVKLFGICGPIELVSIPGEKRDRYRSSYTMLSFLLPIILVFKFGYVQFKYAASVPLAKTFDNTYIGGYILHVMESNGRINSPTGFGSAYDYSLYKNAYVFLHRMESMPAVGRK